MRLSPLDFPVPTQSATAAINDSPAEKVHHVREMAETAVFGPQLHGRRASARSKRRIREGWLEFTEKGRQRVAGIFVRRQIVRLA